MLETLAVINVSFPGERNVIIRFQNEGVALALAKTFLFHGSTRSCKLEYRSGQRKYLEQLWV